MLDSILASESVQEALSILQTEFPLAIWETFYVTVLSTLFASIIGLPLGVLVTVGGKDGILPLPKWLMAVLDVIINLLRSVPFLILMIMVIPLTRLIVGTPVGTVASIVPLTIAAFPFIARLVESSLREVSPNIIEAAQSMGASPLQIIWKVLLPEAMHSIVLGITLAVISLIGSSAMAGALGGGGLGDLAIRYGYQRFQADTMIATVIVLIALVQLVQTIGNKISAKLNKTKIK